MQFKNHHTLPKTNIAPDRRPGPKRKLIFQPVFQVRAVSVRECNSAIFDQWLPEWPWCCCFACCSCGSQFGVKAPSKSLTFSRFSHLCLGCFIKKDWIWKSTIVLWLCVFVLGTLFALSSGYCRSGMMGQFSLPIHVSCVKSQIRSKDCSWETGGRTQRWQAKDVYRFDTSRIELQSLAGLLVLFKIWLVRYCEDLSIFVIM